MLQHRSDNGATSKESLLVLYEYALTVSDEGTKTILNSLFFDNIDRMKIAQTLKNGRVSGCPDACYEFVCGSLPDNQIISCCINMQMIIIINH